MCDKEEILSNIGKEHHDRVMAMLEGRNPDQRLLDFFAGCALAGLLASNAPGLDLARCYEYAQGMMEQQKEQTHEKD